MKNLEVDLNYFKEIVLKEYKAVGTKVVSPGCGLTVMYLFYASFAFYPFTLFIGGKPNLFSSLELNFFASYIITSLWIFIPVIIYISMHAEGIIKKTLFFFISNRFLIFNLILIFFLRNESSDSAYQILLSAFVVLLLIGFYSIYHYKKIENKINNIKKAKAQELFEKYNKQKEICDQANFNFLDKLKSIHKDKYDYSQVKIQEVIVDNKGISSITHFKESHLKCFEHDVLFEVNHKLMRFKGAGCPTCNNLLALEKDEEDEILESIDNRTKEIISISKDNTSKLDIIFKNTENIISLTKKIKDSSSDIDIKINKVIETVDLNYDPSDIESYEKVVKEWFNHWEKLEIKSRLFMPTSEFLFDMINKSDFRDYSPFILYYCRTLEFELLNKIFLKFHDYINRKYDDKSVLFDYDKQNLNTRIINSIEKGPLTIFRSNIIYNKENYTLGVMRFLLDLLPTNNDYKIKSKRYELLLSLQELDKFINNEIGSIESNIISDINKLINEYRNPSAHTGVIEKDKAKEFYREFKLIMNSVMNSFK